MMMWMMMLVIVKSAEKNWYKKGALTKNAPS